MEYIEIIKRLPRIHCAKGAERCEECRRVLKDVSFCLIKVYLEPGNITRPMTEVFVGCRRIFGEYDIVKRFNSDKEAKAYAVKNKIDITFS